MENNGILRFATIETIAMGSKSWRKDHLAWPGFANEDQVKGLVPTMISVNDAIRSGMRDQFLSSVIKIRSSARCRRVMGTIHGTEIFPSTCPDVSHDTANDIANFCKTV